MQCKRSNQACMLGPREGPYGPHKSAWGPHKSARGPIGRGIRCDIVTNGPSALPQHAKSVTLKILGLQRKTLGPRLGRVGPRLIAGAYMPGSDCVYTVMFRLRDNSGVVQSFENAKTKPCDKLQQCKCHLQLLSPVRITHVGPTVAPIHT
jgi:hypothetical protein